MSIRRRITKLFLPRLRNVIRRRETISLRKRSKKVYQAQKALIKENAAWDFIDMYEKTEGKENLYNTDKVHFTDAGYLYIAECMYEKITGKKRSD